MIPQTLTKMNLFVDGKGYAGLVSEVNLPKLKRKTEDYQGGSMDAPIKMGMGLEMLEASFTMYGISKEMLVFFGVADETAFSGNFRGSFKDQKGAVVSATATFRGMLEEVDKGSWKPASKNETKYNAALSYYKLELDGQVVYELDPVNCIRIINGKDELAAERAAIGM